MPNLWVLAGGSTKTTINLTSEPAFTALKLRRGQEGTLALSWGHLL